MAIKVKDLNLSHERLMMLYKTKLLRVLNGGIAKYIFREHELNELLKSEVLVEMRDCETQEYVIRVRPSLRHELLKNGC
jgi:hypothetical protein